MAEPKTASFHFNHEGLTTKADPTLLKDGKYRFMTGMEVVQEGCLSSRSGKKLLGSKGATAAYMIQKMTVTPGENPSTPATNPRYVGFEIAGVGDLYRTLDYSTFTSVSPAINTSAASSRKKAFSVAAYSAGGVGFPWAFIASENRMLKDRGAALYASPLRRWGILPAFGVALVADAGAGNLDGGNAASPNGSQPYDYRYTYVGADTRNEGNPSQTQLTDNAVTQGGFGGDGLAYAGTPISVHNKQVKILVLGTDDPQVAEIAIYRKGGRLFDQWRFVTRIANPGIGVQAAFTDNVADVDLEPAAFLVRDNDPPVPSTPSSPTGAGGTIPVTAAGRQTVALASGSLSQVTPGTVLHCIFDAPEDVVVEAVTGGGTGFTAYFQHAQPAGTTVLADTICGQPCNLALNVGQFILVAGDPSNPHIVYRSKGDTPEAFSILPADGSLATTACGTPSNPIVNWTEFRGQVLTLNLFGLFEFMVLGGSLTQASEVANRGLVALRAWCKTESEVWFLSNDGVWSWDGGTLRKRSEAIDPIFHGEQIEGFAPLDYGANISYAVMEYRRGQVHLLYQDATGDAHELFCEPMFNDRWSATSASLVTFLYAEPDTQTSVEVLSVFGTVSFSLKDQDVLSGGVNYTSDYFTTDPRTQGNEVRFDVKLPWFDFGDPTSEKLLLEAFLDLNVTGVTSPLAVLFVDLLVDFSDTPIETVAIPMPLVGGSGARDLISLVPGQVNGALVQAFGRQARVFSYRIHGGAYPVRMNFFSLSFRYQEVGLLTGGGATDWTNLGSKFDKRLYQMTVEIANPNGSEVLVMDTMTGWDGATYNEAVQTFTLIDLFGFAPRGSSRILKTFPVMDGIIAKEVRIRAQQKGGYHEGTPSGLMFRVLGVDFEKEVYPPDIVSFTPWEDGGSPYLKFANQITLEVNTFGVDITVVLQADGVGGAHDKFTFIVNATERDRQRNVAVPSGLSGYRWRLYVDPTQANIVAGVPDIGNGMFQLFNHSIKFQPADRGEIGHTFDWDPIGHQWDKYLRTVTVEWDNTGGADVTMVMDTINGIGGQTVNASVIQFVLSGGRGKRVFPMPNDTIAKMIRLYPKGVTIPASFKQWKYEFDKEDYPADIVNSTPWKDAESPNDKNPSWVAIDADTGGKVAAVALQNETGGVMAIAHTGSLTNRKKNYAVPPDIFGKMWRLTSVADPAGKFQLFNWGLNRWHPWDQQAGDDPPDLTRWTPWNDFGYPFDKIARNLVLTCDTEGQTVLVALQTAENGTVATFQVNTTYTNRRVVLPCPPDLIGKQWRIVLPNAVSTTIFKLWDWALDSVKEPAAVTQWDSYEQNLGYKFFKFVKQGWWMYQCASPLTLSITSDTGTFTVVLPAHATRSEERFLLPTIFGAGLNKSKLYRVRLSAATPFKFYLAGSGLEFLPIGSDRHAAYQQSTFAEMMGLGEAA